MQMLSYLAAFGVGSMLWSHPGNPFLHKQIVPDARGAPGTLPVNGVPAPSTFPCLTETTQSTKDFT